MYELPEDILNNLEELSKGMPFDKNIYKKLSENYRNREARNNLRDLNFDQAVAYAIGRMPATYGVIKYVLEKFKITGKNFSNILDIGAGVGALKIALRDYSLNYFALEKSEGMRKVLKKLNGENIRIYEDDFQNFCCNNKYEAVFVSYFLNEQKNVEDTLKKIFDLSEKYIFILEPGTPEGYAHIIKAKNIANISGWSHVFPCATKNCLLKNNDWCHFSIRLPRSRLHTNLKNAVLPYEDEKFCYAIFSREKFDFEKNKTVIKRPIRKSGHTIFDICSRIGPQRVISSDKIIKKLNWGDDLNQKILNKFGE